MVRLLTRLFLAIVVAVPLACGRSDLAEPKLTDKGAPVLKEKTVPGPAQVGKFQKD
jgi:hypothetical protein